METADPRRVWKTLGEKPAHGFVGAVVNGRGGEANFQRSTVFAFDGVAAGAGRYAHLEGDVFRRFFDVHFQCQARVRLRFKASQM